MKRFVLLCFACLLLPVFLIGCGADKTKTDESAGKQGEVSWSSLVFSDVMELSYAQMFTVSYAEDGYKLLTVGKDQTILTVPENAPVPQGVPEDVVVLQQPLSQIYMVASASMDYFDKLHALSSVTLSGQQEKNWYLEDVKQAMRDGKMTYAGKYSAPDYELISASGCDLAVENTMIYHTPDVLEQLQRLGIPTIVDKSSYEDEPLGRMEWIKFYGALLNKEEEAKDFFDARAEKVENLHKQKTENKRVAFFFVNNAGAVNVRRSEDYVAKSIALAGGTYVSFNDGKEETSRSTMNIQMETFYAEAVDADILIYNSTIDGEIDSVEDLLAKSPLLKDCKAVQDGNVWCIEKNFYQQPLELGDFILDVNQILSTDPDRVKAGDLRFLFRLK